MPFSKNDLLLGHMGDLVEPQSRTLGLMINIDKIERTQKETKLHLDAVELMQVIPEKDGGGNLAVRKLKPDSEVFKEGSE